MYPLPEKSFEADPPVERIEEASGFYFRSIILHRGCFIPQHIHDHDHATLIGFGRARGWSGEEWIGDKGIGEAFEIESGKTHTFQALEDNTILICVHDIESSRSIKEDVCLLQ